MATVDVRTSDGSPAGTVELPDALFGVQPNVPVMHQVVTAQLAAARRGTQSTKTRAEVAGGGAKPFKQKGTGRARAGSTRAPHWQGGGVALGPKPRSYRQRTPKKMIRLALASALSDRVTSGRLVVVDSWNWSEGKTRHAVAALAALGIEGKTVVVVRPDDSMTIQSFRNLPDVHLLVTTELNAYDILCADWVVFSSDSLPGAPSATPVAVVSAPPAKAATTAPAPAPVEDAAPAPAAVEDAAPADEEDA